MKDEDDRCSDDIVLISLDQMSSKAETNLGPHFECKTKGPNRELPCIWVQIIILFLII
jgi:hypothetical protein